MFPITLLSYVHSVYSQKYKEDRRKIISHRLLSIPRVTLYHGRSIDYNFDSIRVLEEYGQLVVARRRIDDRNDTIHRPPI